MSKKLTVASAVMSAMAALMALLLLATPALAHHADDHPQGVAGAKETDSGRKGGAKPSSKDRTTEDNDDDGTGNTPDPEGDADNQHPSGRDKHAEAGGSGNQGRTGADPDDDGRGPDRTNGGVDQPGGSGGTDELDQDGNNGCGNDDDFEDDNEGLCGRPDATDEVIGGTITAPEVPTEIPTTEVLPELEEKPVTPDEEVLGERIERDEDTARPEGPQVLGLRLSPALNEPVAVAGAVLPFTGGELLVFLIAALGLIGAGALVLRFRSNQA